MPKRDSNEGKIMNARFSSCFRFLTIAAASVAMTFSSSVAGTKPETGVTEQEILLGQTTALTGPLAEAGNEAWAASKAYFEYVNAQGGIHGRKIRLITLDDGYSLEKGVANMKQLIEKDGVFALYNALGTAANMALLETITQFGVPNIAPYTGSAALRKRHNRYVFHVRAGYADEVEKIVEHLGIRGIQKVAVVYINNPFGKEGLESVEQAMASRAQKIHASASIELDGANATNAAATLARTKPQAVLMITAGKQSADFIKAYNSLAPGMQFFTLSVMGTQAQIAAMGKDGVGVVVSQVMPFPFSATSGVVREYQQIMQKMGVKSRSFSSMEGFMAAKVTVEGLRRAGRELTRERFISGLESMRKADFDGYMVDFDKGNRQGSRYVELTVISKDGRFLR
jgi:branched-chain amino acid transport system substrate-binding protein